MSHYGRLAGNDPAAHEPDLATSLNNLPIHWVGSAAREVLAAIEIRHPPNVNARFQILATGQPYGGHTGVEGWPDGKYT